MDMRVRQVARIGIKLRFVAFHRWKDAPDQVAFLRQFHRHLFNVQVILPVEELDRELEFFMVQRDLQVFVNANLDDREHDASCETFASLIGEYSLRHWPKLPFVSVTVDEDGENFANVVTMREDVVV